MSQVVFKRAVEGCMPSVIPVNLEKADHFFTGKVFIHSKIPHKMRGKGLTATGETMPNLLAKNTEVSITFSKKVVLDRKEDPFCVAVEVSGDAELEDALSTIAGLEGLELKSGEKKILHIRVDFGEVVEVSTDLVQTNLKGGVKVDPSHSVVKMAIGNGGMMFIITTLYNAEHCKVAVKLSNEKGDIQQQEYTEVICLDKPVTLAYLLLKTSLDSKGGIKPELNTRLIKRTQVCQHLSQISQKPIKSTEDEPYGAYPKFEGMPDEDYLFNLNDFQPFESTTYHGILEEAKNWVAPLLSNNKLQEALLIYTEPPYTYERLNELSSYFLEYGNALRSNQPAPSNSPMEIEPIESALSPDLSTKLDEITSVIIVAEAGDEFPQHIVQKIIELPVHKRQLLTDVILSTPYGSSRHVYVDEGPYRDPELRPIMSRMGFSIPSSTAGHLLLKPRWDIEDEDEEDMLAASIILMLASEKK